MLGGDDLHHGGNYFKFKRQAAPLIGVGMATFKNIEPYVSARLDLARGQGRESCVNCYLSTYLQCTARSFSTVWSTSDRDNDGRLTFEAAVSPGEPVWETALI